MAVPVIKSAAGHIGKQALATGAHIAGDLAQGRPIVESLEEHGRSALSTLAHKAGHALQRQTGEGLGSRPKEAGDKIDTADCEGFKDRCPAGDIDNAKLEVSQMKLLIRKVEVLDSVGLALEKTILKTPAKYPLLTKSGLFFYKKTYSTDRYYNDRLLSLWIDQYNQITINEDKRQRKE
uniref:Uncharacterized protein n=1 Tax=Romanomermis culicivorax TaxID=13658 RepID=A0A915KFH6_ROMCU